MLWLGGCENSCRSVLRWWLLRCTGSAGDDIGPSPVVVRRREPVPLTLDLELTGVVLAADLGPRLLVHVGLRDIERRWLVGRGGHLVRVVVVDPGIDPLLLGQPGELVVVEALQLAGMLTAVAVELLRWPVWILLCHHASSGFEGRAGREPHRARYAPAPGSSTWRPGLPCPPARHGKHPPAQRQTPAAAPRAPGVGSDPWC